MPVSKLYLLFISAKEKEIREKYLLPVGVSKSVAHTVLKLFR
jgi:hypothetical protein